MADGNPAKESAQMQALYTALAQNRSIAVLSSINDHIKSTSAQDETRNSNFLYDLFMQIHSDLFKDRQQGPVTPSPEKRDALRTAVNALYANGANKGSTLPLFNKDGFVIRRERDDLAKSLAGIYDSLRQIKPFKFGNELTLDLFMVAIARLPSYREVFQETRLDFRRLSKEDSTLLHNETTDLNALTEVFKHALDPERTPVLANTEKSYYDWPNHSIKIHGIKFLTHQVENGPFCLVTVNGGLVPLAKIEAVLDKQILSKKHLADFRPVPTDDLLKDTNGKPCYLPGTESLREKSKTHINGLKVSPDAAPLFCLDLDVVTGLRSHDLGELERLMARVSGNAKVPLFDIVTDKHFYHLLQQAAKPDERLERTVEIAHEHVGEAKRELESIRDTIMHRYKEADRNLEHPLFLMSMGGAGAGKGMARHVMKESVGKRNFVYVSLDEFREKFDLYKVLVAANHHSDDYRVVERPASLLRDMVAVEARKQKKNVVYDGTGIDYSGRYDKIVAAFKAAGYQTQVVAVDKPLPDAIARIIARYKEEHRALPWKVVIDKHVAAPMSFMAAVNDPNLDKISLFANDSSYATKSPDLIAESFTVPASQIRELERHRGTAAFGKDFIRFIRHSSASTLKASPVPMEIEAKTHILSASNGDNLGFLHYDVGTKQRNVLALYDVKRFTQFMEKGLMNPQASYEEGMQIPPSSLPHLAGLWQDRMNRETPAQIVR